MTWFAPWRWFSVMRPWKKWTLAAVVLLVCYAESPILALINEYGGIVAIPSEIRSIVHAPLNFCYHASPAIKAFYDAQFGVVFSAMIRVGWMEVIVVEPEES